MSTAATTHGILAEFSDPGKLIKAAAEIRDAGYVKFDAHSPFPIHGMDSAMGMKRSKLGFIVAAACGMGALAGMALQAWTSTIAYPIVVSGKLLFSWQAFIIVTFALFVLFGAFASVFGMFHLNRLPRLHHPLFYSENFKKFSNDGFFISIESSDNIFDETGTAKFLVKIGASTVEVIKGDE